MTINKTEFEATREYEKDRDTALEPDKEYPEMDLCDDCGCYPCHCEVQKDKFFTVAVVMYDRSYGGPEEGGWWYDTYDPVDEYATKTRVFATKDEAYAYSAELWKWVQDKGLNVGRRSASSVLSEGEYVVYVFHNSYPHYIPEQRPHYE